MKLLHCQFSFVFIFLLFPIIHSGQIKSSNITGKWLLDYNVSSELMDAEVKKVFNNLSVAHLSAVEKVYKGRQMIFMENNLFELKLSDGRSSIGSWELNLSEKVLKIKNEKTDKEYLYRIYELTDEALIIEELDVKGKSYFKKLCFTKLKG